MILLLGALKASTKFQLKIGLQRIKLMTKLRKRAKKRKRQIFKQRKKIWKKKNWLKKLLNS